MKPQEAGFGVPFVFISAGILWIVEKIDHRSKPSLPLPLPRKLWSYVRNYGVMGKVDSSSQD